MSNPASLSGEEGLGIGVAVVAHGALAALLVWHAMQEVEPIKPPERIDVSLATEISLESTAPDPSAEPAASFAPVVSELPAPPESELAPPEPEAVPTRTPRTTAPPPRPAPTATRSAAPRPTPTRSNAPRPTPTPSRSSAPRPTPTPSPSRRGGGSRFNEAFSPGTGTQNTNDTGQPAANFGPTEAASLNAAIQRELRPHWTAPQGADAELLVTVVRFRLNRNGSLNGEPSCIRQSGETPSNRAQVSVHCERAVRAVRLAAPFNLPEQFYDQWRTVTSQFDRRL
ncbi:energy transducer TonB [Erythrobacter sp. EC-HK427]|uniref:energy transducer TonB n=1 Tax=Erythrobacter sp. EC-HK427 TaxID=2038396 RepID=UPI0012555AFD|nr:energy transducer TonB [Erythrobacter sp. EC-HK427]VVT10032.1 conserved hypothetical protein [Erythrobacter sp. EC-HK427]